MSTEPRRSRLRLERDRLHLDHDCDELAVVELEGWAFSQPRCATCLRLILPAQRAADDSRPTTPATDPLEVNR